jgi:hypothetical protein
LFVYFAGVRIDDLFLENGLSCGLLGLDSFFPLLLLECIHVDLDNICVLHHEAFQILRLYLFFFEIRRIFSELQHIYG